MEKNEYLYDVFDKAKNFLGSDIFAKKLPDHIVNNLNKKIKLRPYQVEAVNRYLYYMDTYPQRATDNIQLLFNMATGSGKTVMMACLILDLYKRGYRKFVFFVNSSNIIEKTKDNLTNPASSKYLFNDIINIEGIQPGIIISNNLCEMAADNIYIALTTVQKLHGDLNTPRENCITLEDLTDEKIVMLSDEAHHINSWSGSKEKLNGDEARAKYTWEGSITRVFEQHPENILLEFTATIDLTNPSIAEKYSNKLLYKYDLAQFRLDKYSKEIMVHSVDSDIKNRMLEAVIISQYRRKLAESAGIYLKPVILFKSRRIAETTSNYEEFNKLIEGLSATKIEKVLSSGGIMADIKQFLVDSNLSLEHLVKELKLDFAQNRIIEVKSGTISAEEQLKLNSLEDTENEIRAIFTTDMLNEGWDVLNLYDIVCLYTKRDGRYRGGGIDTYVPGKSTISEAQLIGRGARYYPFKWQDADMDRRKFDKEYDNKLRLLEELFYHTENNTDYINEIKKALRDTGAMAEELKTVKISLKPEFKASDLFKNGVVYFNKQIDNKNTGKKSLADYLNDDFKVRYDVATGYSKTQAAYDDNLKTFKADTKQDLITNTILGEQLGLNILAKAIDRDFNFFNLSNLHLFMPELASVSDFIVKNLYNIKIDLKAPRDAFNGLKLEIGAEEKLEIAQKMLTEIKSYLLSVHIDKIGEKVFRPEQIKKVFKDRVKSFNNSTNRSDVDQNDENELLRLSLDEKEWFAFDKHFGTSEEKLFVKYIDSIEVELKKRFDSYFIVRNEEIKLFDFNSSEAVMPDFILLAKDKSNKNVSYQLFIEVKGEHLEPKDAWKERFLLDLSAEAELDKFAFETGDIKLIGLPFYNAHRQDEFDLVLKDILNEN